MWLDTPEEWAETLIINHAHLGSNEQTMCLARVDVASGAGFFDAPNT